MLHPFEPHKEIAQKVIHVRNYMEFMSVYASGNTSHGSRMTRFSVQVLRRLDDVWSYQWEKNKPPRPTLVGICSCGIHGQKSSRHRLQRDCHCTCPFDLVGWEANCQKNILKKKKLDSQIWDFSMQESATSLLAAIPNKKSLPLTTGAPNITASMPALLSGPAEFPSMAGKYPCETLHWPS